jgi:hypothetical protein
VSKEEVSVTLARNGNSPVRALLVEIEAELKARHSDESVKGMQL